SSITKFKVKNMKSIYCSLVSLIHIIICTQIHVILNLLHRYGSKRQTHKFIFCDTLSTNTDFNSVQLLFFIQFILLF
uniref:Uncharacterized protein n=1 Tax=Aegilops tauschii subsp. strangulata TaxID=200361 RepID=A0A452Y8B7_AEGTS